MEFSRVNKLRWSPLEYTERLEYKCKHSHNGITHPSCFERENDIQERIGILDIETSNLDADFGIILSWCIKEYGVEDNVEIGALTEKDIKNGTFDKRIVQDLITELWKYDRLVTHYGIKFDIPFIRTRAIVHGLNFPEYGMLWLTDTWMISKKKLKLSSNRQTSIARAIQHEDIKTSIHPDEWLAIQFGNKKMRKEAMDYIIDHNLKDVIQCEKNYELIRKYYHETRSSI